MGIRECAWLTISVIVMLMQINIVDAMYKSQNKLKLCFKDKSSCISSSKWDHLTCDERYVCYTEIEKPSYCCVLEHTLIARASLINTSLATIYT